MTNEKPLTEDELSALGDAIALTAALIDAATHRFLTQLREFDRRDGWQGTGALSCAHWLSWRVGMGLGAAREKVRVAHRLAELPVLDEALRKGEISYCKVRAITRVATADNEADLLSMAKHATGAQLEKICRLSRQVKALETADPKDAEEGRRYVVNRATEDGMVSIQLRIHPEEAARVMKAFEVAADRGSLADGAVALAESFLGGMKAEAAALRSKVETVVHISADSLAGQTELGDGISAETSRRLLCDSGVVPSLEDPRGQTIDVGRKTRTIPAPLRRALFARDGGCRFPGCTHTRFLDAHHVTHWVDGGETNLSNTFLACRRHHRFVHEYGYRVEWRGEELVFTDPNGRVIPSQGERPPLHRDGFFALKRRLAETGCFVSPETNLPGWDGERVQYEVCVAALCTGV